MATEDFVAQARAAAAASPGGRLPLPSFVEWATFPFEGDLRVKEIADVVLPEPSRHGEGGVGCHACEKDDAAYVWAGADWRVAAPDDPTGLPAVLMLEPREHHDLADLPARLVASLGPMIFRVERAVLSLGGIGRVQMARWGDGGEHLHLWFLARPEGLVQARGTFLALWDDILPPRPRDEWERDLRLIAASLARDVSPAASP